MNVCGLSGLGDTVDVRISRPTDDVPFLFRNPTQELPWPCEEYWSTVSSVWAFLLCPHGQSHFCPRCRTPHSGVPSHSPSQGQGGSCVITMTWTLIPGLGQRPPGFSSFFRSALGEGLRGSVNRVAHRTSVDFSTSDEVYLQPLPLRVSPNGGAL